MVINEKTLRPVLDRHGLGGQTVQPYDSGSLPVLAVGERHVLKFFQAEEVEHAQVEARVMATVHRRLPVPTPELLATGEQDGWHYVLMSQLRGQRLVQAWPQLNTADRDRVADQCGAMVAALHAIDAAALADMPPQWAPFIQAQRASAAQRQLRHGLAPQWVEQIDGFLQRWLPDSAAPRPTLLHTELMREHFMVAPTAGGWELSGLFDFEPAMVGAAEYDFASVGLFMSCGDARLLRRVLLSYGCAEHALDAHLSCRFMAWALLHRYSKLPWYLERLPVPGATRLEELAAHWWAL
jgi:hygromycin-B 7''-O-kinase